MLLFQTKSENVLSDCSDCQTKCPIRRQTIRTYPPGTALFIGDECVCGGAQETIYEYVPPTAQPTRIGSIIPSGFRPRTIVEPLRSENRVMGNYGTLVFSANVQILNLLSLKNEDLHKGSSCSPKNPGTDRLTATSTENVSSNLMITPTLLPWFPNVTVKEFTPENIGTDETGVTDEFKTPTTEIGEIVSTTTPLPQYASPKVKEDTSETIEIDETSVTDEFQTPTTEIGEIISTTTLLLQFVNTTVKEVITENIRTDETNVTDKTPTGERAVTEKLRNITTSKMHNNIISRRVKEHFVLMINDGFA